jgi:hypothetical protein
MFEGNIMKFRETAAARLLKTRVGFNMTSAQYPSFMDYWKECLSSYPKPAPTMFHT